MIQEPANLTQPSPISATKRSRIERKVGQSDLNNKVMLESGSLDIITRVRR